MGAPLVGGIVRSFGPELTGASGAAAAADARLLAGCGMLSPLAVKQHALCGSTRVEDESYHRCLSRARLRCMRCRPRPPPRPAHTAALVSDFGGPLTASLVRCMGPAATAALVGEFGGRLTGQLVHAFGPALTVEIVLAMTATFTGNLVAAFGPRLTADVVAAIGAPTIAQLVAVREAGGACVHARMRMGGHKGGQRVH